ncbi:acyl-CoA thioesterase [Sphingopyxis sp.]|uniref:acyl-CoA thioesterase n=1 Tax=Sphingopyxis sp. TaxID=1908224 RepID=UPI003D6D1801
MAVQDGGSHSDNRARIRALRPDLFPQQYCIQSRQADLDTLRHISNYSVATILGEARTRMIREFAPRDQRPEGVVFMVGQNATTFVRQSHYPHDCTVGCGLLSIGTSTFRIVQALFQQGECKALGESVLVAVRSDRATPIDGALHQRLASLLLPEHAVPRQLIG